MSNNSSKTNIKLWIGILGLIIILIILVAVNVIAGNFNIRLDVTEDKLYSLSDGTKQILSKVEEPITMMLFVSKSSATAPAYLKTYAGHVEDLLEEYERSSNGKVKLKILDPEPDSDEEELAQEYGVIPAPVNMIGPPVYLGLVASSGSAGYVLPFLEPNAGSTLEYKITRMVQRIIRPTRPKIGVISSMPVMGTPAPRFRMPGQPQQGSPGWAAFRDLKEDYDVIEIRPDMQSIDSKLDALIVVHPKGLSETALFAIDQFVLGGGRMLALVDPSSVADMETSPRQQGQFRQPNTTSDLNPLLNAWGVGYDHSKILADMECTTGVQGPSGNESSPIWLSLRSNNMMNDLVTSEIEMMMMPVAGVLSDGTDKDLTFTPLITSSKSSSTLNSMVLQMGSQAVRRQFKASGINYTIAAKLSGKFKTAFPDGITISHEGHNHPEGAEGEKEKEAEEKIAPGLQEGESVVIVVADVDFIFDRFSVREDQLFGGFHPINNNHVFFINALEQVAGSTELISIRARGKSDRPFDKVIELERIAQAKWQEQEAELLKKLEEAQRRLGEVKMVQKGGFQQFHLSKEQEVTLAAFEKEASVLKDDLKNVQKNLRKDIEKLGMQVKFINILLMPIAIIIGGICFGTYRKLKS